MAQHTAKIPRHIQEPVSLRILGVESKEKREKLLADSKQRLALIV